MKKILKSLLALCLALVMMVEMVSLAEAGDATQRKMVNAKYNTLYSLWNDSEDGSVQTWNCITINIPCSGTMTINLYGPVADGVVRPYADISIFKKVPANTSDTPWKKMTLDGKTSCSASYTVAKGTYYICSGLDARVKYTFAPATTALTAKNVSKKSISLKWKKVAGVDGYQVQYSLYKNFKSAKTVTFKKDSTITGKVKSLKKKKTYYVRVRTYKATNGNTCVSKWSSVKTVKIKK